MALRRILKVHFLNDLKLIRTFSVKPDICKKKENLEISIEAQRHQFPLVWLRDNCRCSKCFDKITNSRIIDWEKFNPQVEVQSVTTNSKDVEVIWSDNHQSVFNYDWLKKRSFDEKHQKTYLKSLEVSKKLWSKNDFVDIFKTFEYKDVMHDDQLLYKYLISLAQNGIVLVDKVPEAQDECIKFANRIGISRSTHYGKTYQVKAKQNATHVAYQPTLLQLHTDLPFYKYKPGCTVLHCIQQAEKGGQNLLTDAFYVAEKLREKNKEVFDILTKKKVNWFDEGIENEVGFNKLHRAPVIVLDDNDKLIDINHNVMKRDSYFTTQIGDVKNWYVAMKIFVEEIYKNAAEFRFKSGQILVFDNMRLLHGRTKFENTQTSSRLLIGAYVDWDELYSKIRVLSPREN